MLRRDPGYEYPNLDDQEERDDSGKVHTNSNKASFTKKISILDDETENDTTNNCESSNNDDPDQPPQEVQKKKLWWNIKNLFLL